MRQPSKVGAVAIGFALLLGVVSGTAGAATSHKKDKAHKAAAPVDRHPGIGATLAAWKAAYGESRRCDPNSCFGSGGENATGSFKAQFVDVMVTDGIVTGYTENFPAHTDITDAELYIEPMLPGDPGTDVIGTPAVIHSSDGTCARWNLTFPTLGSPSSLGKPKIGDTNGTVGIELSSVSATLTYTYNPSAIAVAGVGTTASAPTIAC